MLRPAAVKLERIWAGNLNGWMSASGFYSYPVFLTWIDRMGHDVALLAPMLRGRLYVMH